MMTVSTGSPNPSPDGSQLVYLSYPSGTVSHPADLPVALWLLEVQGGRPRTLVRLFGGQGTMNVNSWSPDGTRFAFVAYPAA